MIRGRLVSLLVATLVAAIGHAQVGRITAQRNAELRIGGGSPLAAKVSAGVNNGDTIQTGRRGFAEITFRDSSMIRVNELTEMVVQDASTLRKVRLNAGIAWVKDRNGGRTSVQTPVGTATARGTEYVITFDGKVDVLEGEVDLENNGLSITLHAGESGGFNEKGEPFKLGEFRLQGMPRDADGLILSWWIPGHSTRGGSKSGDIFSGVSGITIPFLFGSGGSSTAAVGTVPEPATVIGLSGVLAVLLYRRRK